MFRIFRSRQSGELTRKIPRILARQAEGRLQVRPTCARVLHRRVLHKTNCTEGRGRGRGRGMEATSRVARRRRRNLYGKHRTPKGLRERVSLKSSGNEGFTIVREVA